MLALNISSGMADGAVSLELHLSAPKSRKVSIPGIFGARTDMDAFQGMQGRAELGAMVGSQQAQLRPLATRELVGVVGYQGLVWSGSCKSCRQMRTPPPAP